MITKISGQTSVHKNECKPPKNIIVDKNCYFSSSMMAPFTIIIIKTASNPTPIAKNKFISEISVRHNAKIEPTDKSIPLS